MTTPVDRGGVLVVDAANVVGSRPTGWWRDRPAAAAALCQGVLDALAACRLTGPVVVVLEGAARAGAAERDEGGLRVVHAPHGGDDAIVAVASEVAAGGRPVTVVTADRELRERVRDAGGEVVGPHWLTERL